MTAEETESITGVFTAEMPKLEKAEFHLEAESLGADAQPIVITQSEYMRRMKEMSRLQPGMSFYGEMPDMYNVVLNADHRLVKGVLEDVKVKLDAQLHSVEAELKGLNARRMAIEQTQKDKKADEITQEERDELTKCNNDISAQQDKKKQIFTEYAKTNEVIPQLIDLALLQNGLLKGEALTKFLKRSVDLIK